jgi:hypothetical protein
MQQALIDLAQSVTAQVNVQGMGSDRPQEASEAASRDSFNNFITKHFMRGGEVQGQEFDPNSKEKSPSQANRMTSVMDTMSRIGDSKTRSMAVDGKWGPLTNNALRNAYAFASGMLQLAGSFQSPPKSYNQADLTQLKQLIPPDEMVTPVIKLDTNAIQVASTITQHLRAIQQMYSEIKSDILQNPHYQTYIEGDTPFATYKKSGPAFSPQEKQMFDRLVSGDQSLNKAFQVFVPAQKTAQQQSAPVYRHDASGDGANVTISLADLISSDAFSKWYYSPAANAIRGVDTTVLFNAIRQSLQQTAQVGDR